MAAAVASPASMGFTLTAPFPSGQARAGMAGQSRPSGLLAEAGRRLGQPEAWSGATRKAPWGQLAKSEPPRFPHSCLTTPRSRTVAVEVCALHFERGRRLASLHDRDREACTCEVRCRSKAGRPATDNHNVHGTCRSGCNGPCSTGGEGVRGSEEQSRHENAGRHEHHRPRYRASGAHKFGVSESAWTERGRVSSLARPLYE
eukprot:scaffold28864_cov62-Phaeocystis_antarctica.AAC.4